MLFLTNIEPVSIPEALLLSLLGFSIVFIALVSIMLVIKVITVLSGIKGTPKAVAAASAAPAAKPASAATPPSPGKVPAPGSVGDIDLHTVDDPTAAMLMAIVAEDLKVPLNTLRFTSIRQIGEDK